MSGPMQWTQGGFVPAVGMIPNPEGQKGGFVDTGEASNLEPAAVVQRPLRQAKKPAPKNIVTLAKARRRDLKAELKRLKAAEKELAEIERLIAAAENKPKAVVRELKRTAG